MGLAVASGTSGLAVVETPGGMPVTESTFGIPVVKVVGKPGLPVVYVNANNGPVTPPVTYTTWNPSDKSGANVTLSNGNLTAATTNGSAPGVRGIKGFSSGKYYWEATMTDWTGSGAGIGLATATSVFGTLGAGQALSTKQGGGTNGSIYINGAYSGSNLGGRAPGDIIGVAVDLDARLIWFRVAPLGNWNGSGTANPATGNGGLSISALTGSLYPYYGAASIQTGITANFGASAFVGAVPSGFTAGWPA